MKKYYRWPSNRYHYYDAFKLTNGNKTLEELTPKDVPFSRNLTSNEITARSEANPKIDECAVYNHIKKDLYIFLIDGDAFGTINIIKLIFNVRLLNILSSDTFYVIRNLTTVTSIGGIGNNNTASNNQGHVSNLFLEMNRDIYWQTYVPTGTNDKVDNLIAVELGIIISEFNTSKQNVYITLITNDKAVYELSDVLRMHSNKHNNIKISSIKQGNVQLILKEGFFNTSTKNLDKLCKLDELLTNFNKYFNDRNLIDCSKLFSAHIDSLMPSITKLKSILNQSNTDINTIKKAMDEVISTIKPFELNYNIHTKKSYNSYSHDLDLSQYDFQKLDADNKKANKNMNEIKESLEEINYIYTYNCIHMYVYSCMY